LIRVLDMNANCRLKLGGCLMTSAIIIIMLSATFLITPVQGQPESWTRLPSKVADPGDTVYFDVEIKAWFDDIYNFTVLDLPNEWKVHFLYDNYEITEIAINANEQVSIKISIETTEETLPSSYSFTFTATAVNEPSDTTSIILTITIHEMDEESIRDVEMMTFFPDVISEAGEIIEYQITITNTGETDELFYLTSDIPSTWNITYASSVNPSVSSLFLPSGQSTTLTVQVGTPEEAESIRYELNVGLTSQDSVLSQSLELSAELTLAEQEEEPEVEIISQFPEVTVDAGSDLLYPITIRNELNEDVSISLSASSLPENWVVSFVSGDVELSQVRLTSGDSVNLVVWVTPPSTVTVGNYTVTIIGESEEGLLYGAIDLKARVVGSYSLNVETSTLFDRVDSGGSTSITITVTNTGESTLSSVRLEVSPLGDWELSYTPAQVSSLDPKESATFTLTIDVPTDTVVGDYLIDIGSRSDQVTSDDTVQVRVTVETPTSWGLIGIGIAIAVIVVLILVFRKFSRR
jgi:uncharacterized membrane protein